MYPQTDNALTDKIWHVMQRHKGKDRRIDRDRLTYLVFGTVSDNKDRKVRDALSELPVVWNDGYYIPQTEREAQDYIASMRSRQASIGQRLRIVEDYLKAEREPERVTQLELMEVVGRLP